MGLTDRQVAAAVGTKKLSDGGGLYLRVRGGKKRWTYLYQLAGKRREKGLGGYPDVSLKAARREAAKARALVLEGKDPIAVRDAATWTMGTYATQFIDARKSTWRGAHTEANWNWSMAHASAIKDVSIGEVDVQHILKVLKPLWITKPESARQLRYRLEMVLDAAKAEGLRTGDNPAAFKGHLEMLLPAAPASKHHKALPYEDAPSFFQALAGEKRPSSRVLEMVMLTAARSNMVCGARWEEFSGALWTVPAGRMKAGKEFVVPLSTQAQKLVEGQARVCEFVFPGPSLKAPMSRTGLTARLDVTVHGFRSTFRDWAGDKTDYPWDVAEAALAHAVGSGAARAYRRGDALEKRTQLMQDWADFLSTKA